MQISIAHAATVACHRILVQGLASSLPGTLYRRVPPCMKKSHTSVRCVRECRTRDKIQRRTRVLLGGTDNTSYLASGGSADGYHRVPNVNANSDGDFKFNLGNFEKVWNDDNTLLCFCDRDDFSRYFLAGVLSSMLFFHPPSMRPTSSSNKMNSPYRL